LRSRSDCVTGGFRGAKIERVLQSAIPKKCYLPNIVPEYR